MSNPENNNNERINKVLNYSINKLSLLSKSLQQDKNRLNLNNNQFNSFPQNTSANVNQFNSPNVGVFQPVNEQMNNLNLSSQQFSPQVQNEQEAYPNISQVNNRLTSGYQTPNSADFTNFNFGTNTVINTPQTHANHSLNLPNNLNSNLSVVKEEFVQNELANSSMGMQMKYPVLNSIKDADQFVDSDIVLLHGFQEVGWRNLDPEFNLEAHINTKTTFDFNDYLLLYSDQMLDTYQREADKWKDLTATEKEQKQVDLLDQDKWMEQVCNQYTQMDIFEQLGTVLASNYHALGYFWFKWNQLIEVRNKFDSRCLSDKIFERYRTLQKDVCIICFRDIEQSSHEVCITLCGHVQHSECFDNFYLQRFRDEVCEPKCSCSRLVTVFDVQFNHELKSIRYEIALFDEEDQENDMEY